MSCACGRQVVFIMTELVGGIQAIPLFILRYTQLIALHYCFTCSIAAYYVPQWFFFVIFSDSRVEYSRYKLNKMCYNANNWRENIPQLKIFHVMNNTLYCCLQLARQIPSSGSGSSYWSYWGLDSLTSLATNIVENLQVGSNRFPNIIQIYFTRVIQINRAVLPLEPIKSSTGVGYKMKQIISIK